MNRITMLLFAALCLCVLGRAQAQVYKCKVGGAVVFADMPCAGSGEKLTPARAGGPNGSLDFQIMTRHYPVNGDTLAVAYRDMRASSPDGFTGWARWKITYDLEKTPPANNHCSVSAVRIRVIGDILMPQWNQEHQAPLKDQQWWRSMYTGLKRHEDGHVQHGREFGMLLKERLLGLGHLPCETVESRAQQEFQLLYGNLNQRDNEYDRRTDHGRRQDNPQ